LDGLHLYIRDDAGHEAWVYDPPHQLAEWLYLGAHLDYFSFGWRRSTTFQVSIADVSTPETGQVTCGGSWVQGLSLSNSLQGAGPEWDTWARLAEPVANQVAFHPAALEHEADLRVPYGPDHATCSLVVTLNSSSQPTSVTVLEAGYRLFDNSCIETAKRSTFKAATFNGVAVSSSLMLEWFYATISD